MHILSIKLEEKRQLLRPWRRGMVNTKIRIIETARKGVDWIQLPQDMVVADYYANSSEPSGSKDMNLLTYKDLSLSQGLCFRVTLGLGDSSL
jgi:hypothetical protein